MSNIVNIRSKQALNTMPTVTNGRVDGRALHAFLGEPSRFRDWVHTRIREANLTEGDFELRENSRETPSKDDKVAESLDNVVAKVDNPFERALAGVTGVYAVPKATTGGRPSVEYSFTVDAAKKICMLARSDRGDQAREYFLECERAAKTAYAPAALPTSVSPMMTMLQVAMEQQRRLEQLEASTAITDGKATEALARIEASERKVEESQSVLKRLDLIPSSEPHMSAYDYCKMKNLPVGDNLWDHKVGIRAKALSNRKFKEELGVSKINCLLPVVNTASVYEVGNAYPISILDQALQQLKDGVKLPRLRMTKKLK